MNQRLPKSIFYADYEFLIRLMRSQKIACFKFEICIKGSVKRQNECTIYVYLEKMILKTKNKNLKILKTYFVANFLLYLMI